MMRMRALFAKLRPWLAPLILCALLALLAWRAQGLLGEPVDLPWLGEGYQLLSPRALLVLLLAPYFFWVLFYSLADLPWWQRLLSWGLRLIFVALLGLGLSRLVRKHEQTRVFTVFAVDVSDSMSDAALADVRADIEAALGALPERADAKVVTFAATPRALRGRHSFGPPVPELARPSAREARAGSDLSAALQLAYGLFPAGYVKRVVLYSDGVQTAGDLRAEAARAAQAGVRLHTVVSKRPVPPELALRALQVSDKLRVGEPFVLRAQVFASRPVRAKLTLKQGDVINGLDGVRVVELPAGESEIRFQSVVRIAGEVSYSLGASELQLLDDPAGKADTFAENNRVSVAVTVPGRPSVLYIEGAQGRGSYLAAALSAQQFEVDLRSARELPSSARELERYDLVIVSDVPASAVSLMQQEALYAYVRDLGGGFVFAGGAQGYGPGGWAHTTVERMLPVRMDGERQRDEPQVALALVIDRSGSMQGLPIEMAKTAARATADTLDGDDLIEVIGFDSRPTRVVRMTPARNRARIQGNIARITAEGGTEIFSALDMAFQSLSAVRAKRKHAVLLTDGQSPDGGIAELVQSMVADGITLSSVGLGSGVDERLLSMIAQRGGGRYYRVLDAQNLPRVFTREAELVSRSSQRHDPFQPRVISHAGFLRGLDLSMAPFLRGFVTTQLKPAPAQLVLATESGEPLLARWRVGLGWAVAWTSDVKNQWAIDWLRWPGYGQFFGQMVREHMRARKRQEFDLRAELDDATGKVHAVIDAIGGDDHFQNGLRAELSMKGPLPSSETRKWPMIQTAPGRYELDAPLPAYGSYVLRASLSREELDAASGALRRVPVAESFGQVSSSYPAEYRAFEPNPEVLRVAAELTGGQLDPQKERYFAAEEQKIFSQQALWSWFLWAALPVYWLDLLLRRVRFGVPKPLARAA